MKEVFDRLENLLMPAWRMVYIRPMGPGALGYLRARRSLACVHRDTQSIGGALRRYTPIRPSCLPLLFNIGSNETDHCRCRRRNAARNRPYRRVGVKNREAESFRLLFG